MYNYFKVIPFTLIRLYLMMKARYVIVFCVFFKPNIKHNIFAADDFSFFYKNFIFHHFKQTDHLFIFQLNVYIILN
jgi:hypothetical protein